VALVFGWTTAPFFISPIAALLCLELVYLIARQLALSRLASVAATTMVALCPFFVMQAIQPMSDIVGMFWCLAAVAAALATRRGGTLWALAAGFAFGIAVLVRPANLVVLAAVLLALRWRRWNLPALLLGAVPPFLFLTRYDTAVHGAWHRTGYEVAGLRDAFSTRPFLRRLAYYAEWTIRTMSPLVAGGALSAAADRKLPRIDRLLLFCWPAAYFAFYAFHDPYDSWWYLRYLLPGVPAIAIASVVAWRDFVAHPLRGGRARLAAVLSVAVLAIVLFVETRAIRARDVLSTGVGQKAYLTASHWAQRYVPDTGLVLSHEMSGALAFYSDRLPVRWDWLEPARFAVVEARARAQGYSWYALLMPQELESARRAAPGTWTLLSRVPGSDITLWRVDR